MCDTRLQDGAQEQSRGDASDNRNPNQLPVEWPPRSRWTWCLDDRPGQRGRHVHAAINKDPGRFPVEVVHVSILASTW